MSSDFQWLWIGLNNQSIYNKINERQQVLHTYQFVMIKAWMKTWIFTTLLNNSKVGDIQYLGGGPCSRGEGMLQRIHDSGVLIDDTI